MRGGFKAAVQGRLRYRHGINVERWPPPVSPDWRLAVSLLAQLEVDTVIDVGANDGRSGHALRRAGFNGRLISFEPAPDTFHALKETSRDDPRWTVVPMALGSEDAERELKIRRESLLTSFLPSNEVGLAIASEPRAVEATVTVPVRRLDSVLGEYTTEPVFAKIDTQGLDMEVIRGASGVLDRIRGLHVELAVQPVYEGQPNYLSELAELRKLGFEPAGFFPESIVRGKLVEINGLFIRS